AERYLHDWRRRAGPWWLAPTDSKVAEIKALLAGAGHGRAAIDRYLAILGSREDNVTLPLDAPLSPRLDQAERACRWLAWAIPLACVAGATVPLRATRRRVV